LVPGSGAPFPSQKKGSRARALPVVDMQIAGHIMVPYLATQRVVKPTFR